MASSFGLDDDVVSPQMVHVHPWDVKGSRFAA
jgi:hypothetical protein